MSLMAKTLDIAQALLEEMVANSYLWCSRTSMAKKVTSALDLDAFTTLAAQIHTLSRKFDAFTMPYKVRL